MASARAFWLTIVATLLATPTPAQTLGKNLTIMLGSEPGGGTDAVARLFAAYLGKYLPDQPTIIVRNMPGADGIIASNAFEQQVTPDGLTAYTAASTTADPLFYRHPQAHYDPAHWLPIGGVGRGGTTLVIAKDAISRIHDKSQKPAIMGSLIGPPRSGMQAAAWGIEFLDWNVQWVVGYRGTNDITVAMERGEVDMTSTANLFQVKKLLDTGRFAGLGQSGSWENGRFTPRPEFQAPLIADLLSGKINGDIAQKAFVYWLGLISIDKWLALPPGAPASALKLWRDAFTKTMHDPEFLERAQRVSDGVFEQTADDVKKLIDDLEATPPEAMGFMSTMLKKQGLQVE